MHPKWVSHRLPHECCIRPRAHIHVTPSSGHSLRAMLYWKINRCRKHCSTTSILRLRKVPNEGSPLDHISRSAQIVQNRNGCQNRGIRVQRRIWWTCLAHHNANFSSNIKRTMVAQIRANNVNLRPIALRCKQWTKFTRICHHTVKMSDEKLTVDSIFVPRKTRPVD